MLSKVSIISKYLAKLKVYIARSGTYISIINFILLIATFKNIYNINISVYIIVPLGILFGLLLGYIDYKLILRHETEFNNKKNDVKEQMNNIEKMIMEIKNEKN